MWVWGFENHKSWVEDKWLDKTTMTQSFTEEKKGLDFSPRSGEATSGEK